MEIGDQVAILERALKDLITKWERYFAGDLRVPPVDDRERLTRRLRHLSEHPPQRRADQFRAEQLQHRFMSYAMNWERLLREREEGRGRSVVALRGQRPLAVEAPPDATPPSSVDRQDAPSLFDRFVAAKESLGQGVRVDRPAFEAQLATQKAQLEERLGHPVQFDVRVEDGKVKLAARRQTDGGRRG